LVIFKVLKDGKKLGGWENKVNEYVAQITYQYEERDGLKESDINPQKEWDFVVTELKKINRQDKLKKIELDLKRAEENNDEKAVEELMIQLQTLLNS